MGGIDVAIFHWINRWPEGLSGFFVFISEATKQGSVRIALATLVAILCLSGKMTRKATLLALAAWPLADGFSGSLKNMIAFERPCVALPDAILRVHKLTTFGTASSHAANMAAIATVFWLVTGWRGGVPWTVVAFVTGLSRIYVGVHFPSQVMLGWLCGALVGMIVVKTWQALVRLRTKPQSVEIDE